MPPLYAARIEDLGQGDFVKVDCAACHHVAVLAAEVLLRLGLSPQTKVLDLKEQERVRCRDVEREGELRFRSSGGARAHEPIDPRRSAGVTDLPISLPATGAQFRSPR